MFMIMAIDEVPQYLQTLIHAVNEDPLMIWDEIKAVFLKNI